MLEGSLKDFTLDDLLQMISLGGKTGELYLSGETPFGKRTGKIFFEQGQVKHAEIEHSSGEIAILELLNIKEGNFKFLPADVSNIKRTVQRTIPDLILLSTSKLDEWNKISNNMPSVDTTFSFSSEEIPPEIYLSSVDWKVLTILGKGETIRETALKLNMTVFDVAKIAYELLKLKILREKGIKETVTEQSKIEDTSRNSIFRIINRTKKP
jgi:hypothetical protein